MTLSETIWKSAQNLLASQANLDKLFDAFDAIECVQTDLEIKWDDSDFVVGDWVRPVWAAYYKVRQRPKKKLVDSGWITIAIQLTSDEGLGGWEHGKKAKVLAGFIPKKDDWWFFDTAKPDAEGRWGDCVAEEYRWFDPDDEGWFFAVPLDKLTNTESVEKYVTTPLREMIAGVEPAEAFAGIADGVCCPPK